MALRGVLRAGEVAIRVMDMKAARQHYGDRMGLHEMMTDDTGRVYYKAWDEHDHHSIVLREADSPGMDYFAFKVFDDATLTTLEQKLEAFGLQVERIEAGVYPKSGRRIQFVLPSGHTMQLYAHKEQVGNTLGLVNPGVVPDEGVIRGFRINRLDHLLLGGGHLDENVRLFTEVFDFDLGEKLVDHESGASLAVFLSCSTKPHDIAFVLQPQQNKFHHVSFLLESAHDVIKAADMIGKYRIPVDVGPNRHGVTRGATIYFFDPSGNRNEVFAEGYVHYPDTPTLVWDTRELGQATFSQDNTPRESFLTVLT
ncbi:MAG TPA: catechol 2,3-dioxygenase [Rhodocyclaceae bacterium]|nr:catechol 2,3-dioxygenase [Rhodocyclaceae bacterium]HMV54393.1 catechol 2,3-dioxygenase [Rhodocyclaceae bacterium]HMZ84093.1 catechol 2,3-dioxygenase [Rhodocyclaceae bacterium]HNA04818.1 catechol 2,3-dioxygenase [Rhodocyclaceae bacterium]HNB79960.1 catechol 2,3-dioxygenase [Rhodocyclaceae bacterium]